MGKCSDSERVVSVSECGSCGAASTGYRASFEGDRCLVHKPVVAHLAQECVEMAPGDREGGCPWSFSVSVSLSAANIRLAIACAAGGRVGGCCAWCATAWRGGGRSRAWGPLECTRGGAVPSYRRGVRLNVGG